MNYHQTIKSNQTNDLKIESNANERKYFRVFFHIFYELIWNTIVLFNIITNCPAKISISIPKRIEWPQNFEFIEKTNVV